MQSPAAIALAREVRRHAAAERAFAGDEVRRQLAGARSALRARLDEPAVRLLAEIAGEERALDDHDQRRHEDARFAIQQALRRLRGSPGSHALSHDAPAELRDACGFTRVMISRARGSRWYPDTMRVRDGADPEAEEFERFATEGNEIPLGRMLPETRMVRQGVAVLVADTTSDAYKPLIRVTRSTGYVAAPITSGRRIIGFLHADRAGQRSAIAAGDLECIALFTAEFSLLFERAVLAERIERQRSEVAAALRQTASELDARSDARIVLGTYAPSAGPRTDTPAPRRDALLTPREREIVELIAAGATNHAVARELVLSTDTVKTHVSSILRKLDATSRAEAVVRYLRLRAQ